MAISEDIAWFKTNFGSQILASIAGTPISLDLVCAIAVRETGEVWRPLRRSHSVENVLRLAVGDVIGAPKRKAFPRAKDELLAVQDGAQMFDIARTALGEMANATGTSAYKSAFKNPDNFCHAFGIFQNDIQHFKQDKNFFLEKSGLIFFSCLKNSWMRSELLSITLAIRPKHR